jgi:hypothetical protein
MRTTTATHLDAPPQVWPVDLELVPRPWARRDALAVLERALSGTRLAGARRVWIRREHERLRVLVADPAADPLHRIRTALAPLVADGTLRDLQLGEPAPLSPHLDGPLGQVLGRYLDHDAAAWLSWERRHPLGDRSSAAALSQAVLGDLAFRCIRLRNDRVALWTHLGGLSEPERAGHLALVNLAALPRRCAPWLRTLTEAYFLANTRFAEDLRAGATALDTFELLELIAALHWRRFDLSPPTIATICANLSGAADPRDGVERCA